MSPCFRRNSASAGLWRFALVGLMLSVAACDTDPSTLFDPDAPFGPDPVISSIAPADSALAGVSVVTITGQNFSTTPGENLVYFGSTRAPTLSATATELTVRAPNEPSPDVTIKLAVIGAENFSNNIAYRLNPAATSFANVGGFEEPVGVTSDSDGNLYVSMLANSVPAGIQIVTPDGARSEYASSTFRWDDLALGPDGYLYAVRNLRAVFRFPPGGGGQETWTALADRSVRLSAITFDDAGNLWGGGGNAQIFRIAPDKSVLIVDFDGIVSDMAVFSGFLYVAVEREGVSTVERLPLDASGNPGTVETYFSITNAVGSDFIPGNALAFAATGELFVGTELPDPILLVRPDGSWESLYPGVLEPTVSGLAWGPDPFLYATKTPNADLGTEADIVRINTQLEGGR
ncbi:MAG: hypothetical protein HKN13_09990 [Rhodothermales bacterium]|nr:hypothetical protein [Rhodothermales bacterium]